MDNTENSTLTSSPAKGPRATLIEGWTKLWNGDLGEAGRVGAASIAIHFGGRAIGQIGDRVRTPDEVAALISDFRPSKPGLRYSIVEAHTTDHWGHCVWDACLGDLQVGGIDTFAIDATGITQVHSVTAERPMSR